MDLFGIKKTRNRREMWQRVATELGGAFHLAKGFWKRTNERIEVTLEGVPLVLDTYVESSGNSSTQYTRVGGPYTRGPGPKLKITRQGVLGKVAKAIGMTDIALFHAAFDAHYFVRTSQPGVARRLWTIPAMERMLARFPDVTLQGTPERVELVTMGTWNEELAVRDALALLAQLCSRDVYGVEALRAVPGAKLVQPPGAPPRIELDTGTRVVISADDTDEQVLLTVARTSEPVAREPLMLSVIDGKPTEPELATKLPQGAHVALRSVGTGTLVVDGVARFAWQQVEEDPAHLRAAAELLGALAVDDAGVYR